MDTKHFSDLNGKTTELAGCWSMRNAEFAARFPGVKGRRIDSFTMMVGQAPDKTVLPITRSIRYKCRPSLHECNAKCRGGKRSGTCECKCGGRNHGVAFTI